MAILTEEGGKKINWFLWSIIGVILLAIFLGGYYLFFTASPLIEVVLPQSLQAVEQLTAAQIDPSKITSHPRFSSLKTYAPPLTIGQIGRANPFLPF